MSYLYNEQLRMQRRFESMRQRDGKWVMLAVAVGFLLGVLVGMWQR